MVDLAARRTFWREQVALWRDSGLSQSAFCRGHGLKSPTLAYWIKRLRDERPSDAPLTLVAANWTPSAAGVSLVSPLGWRLNLPGDVAPDWLARLMRELAC